MFLTLRDGRTEASPEGQGGSSSRPFALSGGSRGEYCKKKEKEGGEVFLTSSTNGRYIKNSKKERIS